MLKKIIVKIEYCHDKDCIYFSKKDSWDWDCDCGASYQKEEKYELEVPLSKIKV